MLISKQEKTSMQQDITELAGGFKDVVELLTHLENRLTDIEKGLNLVRAEK